MITEEELEQRLVRVLGLLDEEQTETNDNKSQQKRTKENKSEQSRAKLEGEGK